MLLAIVINTKPLLNIICIYVLWEEPTATDIIGVYNLKQYMLFRYESRAGDCVIHVTLLLPCAFS